MKIKLGELKHVIASVISEAKEKKKWNDMTPDERLADMGMSAEEIAALNKKHNKPEEQYPDTLAGAKAALKMMSSFNHKKIDAAKGKPDPSVNGVWVLYNVSPDGLDAVVYLKGYNDPFGNTRTMNDFEEGQVRN